MVDLDGPAGAAFEHAPPGRDAPWPTVTACACRVPALRSGQLPHTAQQAVAKGSRSLTPGMQRGRRLAHLPRGRPSRSAARRPRLAPWTPRQSRHRLRLCCATQTGVATLWRTWPRATATPRACGRYRARRHSCCMPPTSEVSARANRSAWHPGLILFKHRFAGAC